MRGAAAGLVALLASSAASEAFAQTAAGAMGVLSTADTLVKVVGGAVAAVVTVLGLPLVYQTFRKTQAEITKINLEAAKLAREAAGASLGASPDDSQGIRVSLEGNGNIVTIATDPRLKGPLLVLIDALIASIFSWIATYALNFLPLRQSLYLPLQLGIYAALFWPVLRSALRVKKELGAGAWDRGADTERSGDQNGRQRWWSLSRFGRK